MCVGGGGVPKIAGITECDETTLWWWVRGRPRNVYSMETPGTRGLDLTQTFGDQWKDTCFVQFLLLDADTTDELR